MLEFERYPLDLFSGPQESERIGYFLWVAAMIENQHSLKSSSENWMVSSNAFLDRVVSFELDTQGGRGGVDAEVPKYCPQ